MYMCTCVYIKKTRKFSKLLISLITCINFKMQNLHPERNFCFQIPFFSLHSYCGIDFAVYYGFDCGSFQFQDSFHGLENDCGFSLHQDFYLCSYSYFLNDEDFDYDSFLYLYSYYVSFEEQDFDSQISQSHYGQICVLFSFRECVI